MPPTGATDSSDESVRPDNTHEQPLKCCRCGCVMVEEESSRIIAPVEDGIEEGEVHVEEESEEDSAELKHAKDIASPSRDAVEQHRVTHLPYRSWCKQCVMGRGIGKPHATVAGKSSVLIVGQGYFCITHEGLRRHEEMANEMSEEGDGAITQATTQGEIVKCLLIRCF